MATTIFMPQLASTMESGTVVQWLKQVGDKVIEGEAIMEITTDKVDVEVESPASGVLLKILVNPGDEVPVKKPIGIIGSADEGVSSVTEKLQAEKVEVVSQALEKLEQRGTRGFAPSEALPPKAVSLVGRIFASPRARRLAKEANIEITAVAGTGPDGRIVSRDVEKYIKEAKRPTVEAKPLPGQIIKLSPIQKVTAERLSASYRTAPHIDLFMDVNCERMIALRALLRSQGCNASYNDIFAKYTGVVLREFPKFNSTYADDGIHLIDEINIGIAVSAGEDLIVPVVKNVDKKNIMEITNESARLINATRDKKLSLEDLSGGTLTITNLGMYGIRYFKAIINPPQVAILAVGAIEPRAIVIPGQIIAQQMMTLTLSIDHRVVNGAQGGQFLARLKELLEIGSLDILMNRPISL